MKPSSAKSPVNRRDTGAGANDCEDCIAADWSAISAEMLITGAIKMPFFTGSKCRLTFLTPRGRDTFCKFKTYTCQPLTFLWKNKFKTLLSKSENKSSRVHPLRNMLG